MTSKFKTLCLSMLLVTGIAHANGPGDVGSVGSDINQDNVQGQYMLKGKDVYIQARITLKKNYALMQYADTTGMITCKGTYKYDEANLLLTTKFPKCGNVSLISHQISLAGTSIEALQSSATVNVSIAADSQVIPSIPFTLTKEK